MQCPWVTYSNTYVRNSVLSTWDTPCHSKNVLPNLQCNNPIFVNAVTKSCISEKRLSILCSKVLECVQKHYSSNSDRGARRMRKQRERDLQKQRKHDLQKCINLDLHRQVNNVQWTTTTKTYWSTKSRANFTCLRTDKLKRKSVYVCLQCKLKYTRGETS